MINIKATVFCVNTKFCSHTTPLTLLFKLSSSVTKHDLRKTCTLYQTSNLALNILPLSLDIPFFCCLFFFFFGKEEWDTKLSFLFHQIPPQEKKRCYYITPCTENAEVKTKDTAIPKHINSWNPISSINIHLSQPHSKIAKNLRKA